MFIIQIMQKTSFLIKKVFSDDKKCQLLYIFDGDNAIKLVILYNIKNTPLYWLVILDFI